MNSLAVIAADNRPVISTPRELLRLKPRTATYQLIRVEDGEVVLLNTATGDLLKKPLPK